MDDSQRPPVASSTTDRPDLGRAQTRISLLEKALRESCEAQFELATRIAANIGYKLIVETTVQQAEDGDEDREFVRDLFKLADDDRVSSELIGIRVRNTRAKRRGQQESPQ
jgi:hypothetical protein